MDALGSQQRKQYHCSKSRKSLIQELKACCNTKNLDMGKQIHVEAIASGSDASLYVASALVNMYAKCGHMTGARQVFDRIKHPDVVVWTALISGYAALGENATALDMFARMVSQGCAPDRFTLVAALKACICVALEQDRSTRAGCLERGKRIHSMVDRQSDAYVLNTLIDMYAKCGNMQLARQVFERMKHPDIVSWNTIILGYAENGERSLALELFERMQLQGCLPNSITFRAALKACTLLGGERARCLEQGRQIHSRIGCHSDIYVQTALVSMYAKCGSMAEAREVFDGMKQQDMVAWTALIMGYAENGEGLTALNLFERMRLQCGKPNAIALIAALKACSSLASDQDESGKLECLYRGRQIHDTTRGHSDTSVNNTLIDMYAKCGSMAEARQIFDSMKPPSVVSWNALILGYAENGEALTSLNLLSRMKAQGLVPNSVTFLAALRACGLLGALEAGRKLHSEMQTGTELDSKLLTSLVDFYAKCGSTEEARRIFELNPTARDLATWTALIAGYSRLGEDRAALDLFERMQDAGFQPNGVTFLCILTCCCHAGLVEKASEVFKAMPTTTRTVEHYTCMVDVLGRSNKLDEAMALLQRMPCRPDAVTWMTVLGACRKWRNIGIARLAFASFANLDEADAAAAYVVMEHIYGSRGMREEQKIVSRMRKRLPSACRRRAQSCWTNELGEIHVFLQKPG